MSWEKLADVVEASEGPSLNRLAAVLHRRIAELDRQREVLVDELAKIERKRSELKEGSGGNPS